MEALSMQRLINVNNTQKTSEQNQTIKEKESKNENNKTRRQ